MSWRDARSARIPLHFLTIRHWWLIRSECRRVRSRSHPVAGTLPTSAAPSDHVTRTGSPTSAAPACHVERNRSPTAARAVRPWRRFSRVTAVQRGGRGSASCKVAPHVRHLKAPTTYMLKLYSFLHHVAFFHKYTYNAPLRTFHFNKLAERITYCFKYRAYGSSSNSSNSSFFRICCVY